MRAKPLDPATERALAKAAETISNLLGAPGPQARTDVANIIRDELKRAKFQQTSRKDNQCQ